MRINRRIFVQHSFLTAVAAASAKPAAGQAAAPPIVDTHVYLSRWPFRRLPDDETARLVRRLRAKGVTQAWAGSFDGVFHKDVDGANRRLAEECRSAELGFLLPFGSVNPTLPDWQEDLRRCHEVYRMPGIRLHPGYHGYRLSDRTFKELLLQASERGLVVQLAPWLEDERHHHPLMPVAEPDLEPLLGLVESLPSLRLVLLNTARVARAQSPLLNLGQSGRVWFDFARLDALLELEGLLRQASPGAVVFGSYAPMFYPESALLKMQEADLGEEDTERILHANAKRILGQAASVSRS